MEPVNCDCPSCGGPLEFARTAEFVVCEKCGTAFEVERGRGAVALSRIGGSAASGQSDRGERLAVLDKRLEEIDELLGEGEAEVEAARSRLQGAPLGLGCSFLGLFGAVMLVIVVFMLAGRSYFGGWLFYLSIALILMVGFLRLRIRRTPRAVMERWRTECAKMESAVRDLHLEEERLIGLRARLIEAETAPIDRNR